MKLLSEVETNSNRNQKLNRKEEKQGRRNDHKIRLQATRASFLSLIRLHHPSARLTRSGPHKAEQCVRIRTLSIILFASLSPSIFHPSHIPPLSYLCFFFSLNTSHIPTQSQSQSPLHIHAPTDSRRSPRKPPEGVPRPCLLRILCRNPYSPRDACRVAPGCRSGITRRDPGRLHSGQKV